MDDEIEAALEMIGAAPTSTRKEKSVGGLLKIVGIILFVLGLWYTFKAMSP